LEEARGKAKVFLANKQVAEAENINATANRLQWRLKYK